MINGKEAGFIIAVVYVTVYIVLTLCRNPRPEYFSAPPSISLQRAIEEKRSTMNNQINKQADQNKRISVLKSKIDVLRNELTIIKEKENNELASIHKKILGSDSIVEAISDGGKELGNMINGNRVSRIKGGGSGKNYNLNFNLDEE